MAGLWENDSPPLSSRRAPPSNTNRISQYGSGASPPLPRAVSSSSSEAVMAQKRNTVSRPHVYSSSSRDTGMSTSTRAENRDAQRAVRSLPPWISSFEHGDEANLSAPHRVHAAQHNHTPIPQQRDRSESKAPARKASRDGFVDDWEDSHHGIAEKKAEGFFGGHREPVRGRKWDHARDGDPVIMQHGIVSASSPWAAFIKSSQYGPGPNEDRVQYDQDFLDRQTPGYATPWRGDLEAGRDPEKSSGLLHSQKRRKNFIQRLQNSLLTHPLVPLVFRIIVLTTSLVALGLSGSVHHLSNIYKYAQNPSTTMAIVVDVVAIPYILYVTWDEYTGKPLGLRSPKAKIRLVLLDLFFIIFESANLALAFAALTDSDGSCKRGDANGKNNIVCDRVKALCGILMIALIAWSLTFAVSIFRLVERVGGREETE